jgi:predicted RNA-binding protein YlqC (UPF0109 family)
MQAFLEFVLRQLVDHPDDVLITHEEAPKKITFHVRLQKSDIGKVVGKHGQTLTAIRNVMNAAAGRRGLRVGVEIVEERAA